CLRPVTEEFYTSKSQGVPAASAPTKRRSGNKKRIWLRFQAWIFRWKRRELQNVGVTHHILVADPVFIQDIDQEIPHTLRHIRRIAVDPEDLFHTPMPLLSGIRRVLVGVHLVRDVHSDQRGAWGLWARFFLADLCHPIFSPTAQNASPVTFGCQLDECRQNDT